MSSYDYSVLRINQILRYPGSLISANRRFRASIDPRGDFLVTLHLPSSYYPIRIWGDEGERAEGEYAVVLHDDGNLCCHGYAGEQLQFPPYWCSESVRGKGADYFLKLHDDGSLALYHGTPERPGDLYWWNAAKLIPADGVWRIVSLVPSGKFDKRLPYCLSANEWPRIGLQEHTVSIEYVKNAEPRQCWTRYDRYSGNQFYGFLFVNQEWPAAYLSGFDRSRVALTNISDRAWWRFEEAGPLPDSHALQPYSNLYLRLNVAGDGPAYAPGTAVVLWPYPEDPLGGKAKPTANLFWILEKIDPPHASPPAEDPESAPGAG